MADSEEVWGQDEGQSWADGLKLHFTPVITAKVDLRSMRDRIKLCMEFAVVTKPRTRESLLGRGYLSDSHFAFPFLAGRFVTFVPFLSGFLFVSANAAAIGARSFFGVSGFLKSLPACFATFLLVGIVVLPL
jgi:hypothetical protein